MKKFVGFFIGVILFAGQGHAADKVETIQNLVRTECKKKVTYDAALAMIRPLYLTCVPGTKVSVDNSCLLKCLKPNSGAVIGR